MKTKDYVVGKGRPPTRTRWKPGQSGNPKGRRKGVKNMTTYFDEALSRKIDVKVGGKTRRMSVREGVAMNAANLALKGDIKMIALMLGIEREVSALVERQKIEYIDENTTPEEAMRTYRRAINGEY